MKKYSARIISVLILAGFLSVSINAQDKDHSKSKHMKEKQDSTIIHKKMHDHKSMNDSTKLKKMKEHMDHKSHKVKEMTEEKESIVREGVIDLISIDKNNDGKVFQDQMCWNVISDDAGNCPLCNMKLKELSLEKTKKKLIEKGYKVK